MPPPTLADKEAAKLRLRQQFGIEEMPYYIEQAQKQFSETHPPDWIFLYKWVVPTHRTQFIRADVWKAETPQALIYVCISLDDGFEEVGKMLPAKDALLAATCHGFLTPEDSNALIQLAQQPQGGSLNYLQDWYKQLINGPIGGPWTEAVILRRQPSEIFHLHQDTFSMFLYRKLVSAIRDTPEKIVDRKWVEVTVGDVV